MRCCGHCFGPIFGYTWGDFCSAQCQRLNREEHLASLPDPGALVGQKITVKLDADASQFKDAASLTQRDLYDLMAQMARVQTPVEKERVKERAMGPCLNNCGSLAYVDTDGFLRHEHNRSIACDIPGNDVSDNWPWRARLAP